MIDFNNLIYNTNLLNEGKRIELYDKQILQSNYQDSD